MNPWNMFFRVAGKEITIIFKSDFQITVSQMQKIGELILAGKPVTIKSGAAT